VQRTAIEITTVRL